MISYYYGDVDEHGRLVEHVTVARDTDITPADMAKPRGVGSTVRIMATGIKWMYTASGWTIDNTPEGGGSTIEPHELTTGGEMMSGSYLRLYKAPLEVLAYAINNGLVDTSQETNLGGLLAYVYGVVSAEDAPDLGKIDTSSATDMSYMFFSNGNVQNLDLSGFDTGFVTTIEGIFEKCTNLRSIDTTGWDTRRVTTIARAFFGCQLLPELDLSGWDVSAVTTLRSAFYETPTLRTIDMTGWRPKPTGPDGLQEVFDMCGVTALDLSGWDVSNATSMSNTFYSCRQLTDLDITGWDTSKVSTFQGAFFGLDAMEELDLSALNTSAALNLGTMCGTSRGNTATVTIKAPAVDDRSRAKSTSSMFAGASTSAPQYARTIYAPKCRSSNAYGMFRYCTHMTDLHLEGFDCHEATNVNLLFGGCSALQNVYTDAQTVMPAINFTMADCTQLTEQSMVNIFNALPTVTAARTISLAAAAKARLTETDIAIATDKGWTIA